METILKHLRGDEQYKYLQKQLADIIDSERLPVVIQKIIDDINTNLTNH